MRDTGRNTGREPAIRAAVFLLPPLLLLGLERLACGEIGALLPDAQLYLSIADNAIETGHFTQTARPITGFVVPPGLPFALLLLRMAHFPLPMITAVQALLMGGSCLLLYETGKRLFGRWGILAPAIYCLVYLRCRLYLGNLFVEHWYLALLCVMVWLCYREMEEERRLLLLNAAGLAAMLVRPALMPLYLAVLLYALVIFAKDRRLLPAILVLLLPALLLGLNCWVNYRETGEVILLQNYSGTDLFYAFSPDGPVTREQNEAYNNPVYYQVYGDPSLTMSEKSRTLAALAKACLRQDPLGAAGKTVKRGFELYIKCLWAFPLAALAGGVRLSLGRKGLRAWLPLAVNLALALTGCLGIPELRYAMPIWPLASLHAAALAQGLWLLLLRRKP
jgi:hypothetical protein